MTDLTNLDTFVAAVRAGSFAAAARQLGVSAAMVGRRIEALEARYGTRLIERTTRTQRLTAAGEAFLVQVETVLDSVAELDELTRTEPGQLSGRIRVTGPATLGIYKLATITAAFCAAHPGVTIEMSLNDRRADIIAEGYDLAVRIGELQPSAMVARRVGTYRFQVAAAPAYVAASGMPLHPRDLATHCCILNINMVPRSRWPFYAADGTAETAEVDGNLMIDNGEALLAAALGGAGIVYLPVHMVEPALAAGTLVEVLPGWRTTTMPIHLLHPGRRLVPRRLRAYMDAIADGLHEAP
jgi:DNA-binding transcriptional LysR family regulator